MQSQISRTNRKKKGKARSQMVWLAPTYFRATQYRSSRSTIPLHPHLGGGVPCDKGSPNCRQLDRGTKTAVTKQRKMALAAAPRLSVSARAFGVGLLPVRPSLKQALRQAPQDATSSSRLQGTQLVVLPSLVNGEHALHCIVMGNPALCVAGLHLHTCIRLKCVPCACLLRCRPHSAPG